MPSPVRSVPHGAPSSRRLGTLVQGALLLMLVLCAAAHGAAAEETRGPVPAAVPTAQAAPGGTEPQAPHAPHGAHQCASDAVVRVAAQGPEQPVADANAPAAAAAGAALLGPPLAFRAKRGGRRPRTGRAALVVTSRWRI
ncbi:hypothetical protein [Streptomyces bullii]|uniref:Uncharacterized protein n=1 Tax=Streptomyces bullii TaxID=349910 RepID=A0ABW0UR83_9ACTN